MGIVTVTDALFFQVLALHPKIMAVFTSKHCGACSYVKPVFERLAQSPDFNQVTFIQVDSDQNPIAGKFAEVYGLPYFAVFQNGLLLDGASTTRADAVAKFVINLKALV